MTVPGSLGGQEPARSPSPKDLSDRELLEAVYRAVYGEEPIQPGLARRVTRLEYFVIALTVAVASAEGLPILISALS